MNEQPPHETHRDHQTRHGNHGWIMIACCIPMLAIASVLVATGVLSVGFLLLAVGCTAMMALMMRGVVHGGPATAARSEQDDVARDADGTLANQQP